jgi:hypothetical protein
MKFLNHFWSISIIGDMFPGPFINVVSMPLNKILSFLQLILESKNFETSNSSFPSISIKRGGIQNLPGIDDSLYSSSK